MKKIEIYYRESCPYCQNARAVFDNKQVSYELYHVDEHPALKQEMIARSGRHTVPQIFIDNYHVGGCSDLLDMEHNGELDNLLFAYPV